MKILLLIFDNNNNDNNDNNDINNNNIEKKWEQNVNTNSLIMLYFVKFINGKIRNENNLNIYNDDKHIYINNKYSFYDSICIILNYLKKNLNFDFDYLLKTKITSFILLNNLISFIYSNNIDYAGICSNKKILTKVMGNKNKYYPSNDIFILSKKSVEHIINYDESKLSINVNLSKNYNQIYDILNPLYKFTKIKKQIVNKKNLKYFLLNYNCLIYDFKKNLQIEMVEKYIENLLNTFYCNTNTLNEQNTKVYDIFESDNKINKEKFNLMVNFTNYEILNYKLIKIPYTISKSKNINSNINPDINQDINSNINPDIVNDIINVIKNNNIKKNDFMFKKLVEQLEINSMNDKIDFTSDFDVSDLNDIYENIDNFVNLFINYEKVLIVCEYSEENYLNLIKLNELFAKANIELHIFFLKCEKFDKIYFNIHYLNTIDIIKNILNIKFKPNIVISIDNIDIDFKKIYNCFLIRIYTKIQQDNFNKINNFKNLNIIKNSDLIFTYSYHLKDGFVNTFKKPIYLLYYHFIKFYGRNVENDNVFKIRKYDFGLKVNSCFEISSYEKQINYLRNKNNVLILGDTKNFNLSNNNTDANILIDNNNFDFVKSSNESIIDVKYFIKSNLIIDDYDVECLLNGCFVIKNYIEINYTDLDQIINFKPNNKYIIGNFTKIYNDVYLPKLFKKNSFEGYIINQEKTKEILIFVELNYIISLNILELFEKINLNDIQIGVNNDIYDTKQLINMYYLFGNANINKNIIGIDLFYSNYIKELENNQYTRNYNKNIFCLTTSYYWGVNKKNVLEISNLLENVKYHSKNMLLISKIIKGYGGVQKSSKQIIETFDKIYNVFVISNNLNNLDYDYEIDVLDNSIHNSIIIKNKKTDFLKKIIDSSEFTYILNNKLKKVLELDFNNKIDCICHNSMDEFNLIILENQKKINRLYTINNFHKNLMICNKFSNEICLFNNYVLVDTNQNPNPNPNLNQNPNSIVKQSFSYNIGFIGRLTKEKNVQLLIDAVNYFNNSNELDININLYIIGSGNVVMTNINKNIKIIGMLSHEKIEKYYKIFDYVISSSLTEGKPFSIIESLSYGIPCIHSNINGINEIIYENYNGFLFNFVNYENIRFEMKFDKLNTINNYENIENVINVLEKAYSIDINKWNIMSKNSILSIKEYEKNYCMEKNLLNSLIDKNKKYIKKINLFINFKSDNLNNFNNQYSYLYHLINDIINPYNEFIISYNLEEYEKNEKKNETNIDVFFVHIPFETNKCIKYTLDDVIKFNSKQVNKGKIIIKLDDFDKSINFLNLTKSNEFKVIKNIPNVDFVIFNSNKLQKYYLKKISDFGLKVKNNVVIYDLIKQKNNKITNKNYKENLTKIKIIDFELDYFNINDHKIYIDLWNYSLIENNTFNEITNLNEKFCDENVSIKSIPIEFIPLGSNIPEPIIKSEKYINYYKKNLPQFEKYHIYITNTIKENSYNCVSNALNYQLPILYPKSNNYLCEFINELTNNSNLKIGEFYTDFNDLIKKINIIKNNYLTYKIDIEKIIQQNVQNISKYNNIFLKSFIDSNNLKNLKNKMIYKNNILKIDKVNSYNSNKNENKYIFLNDKIIKLIDGINVFVVNSNTYETIETNYLFPIQIEEFTNNNNKLSNDKINVLLCSDEKYFVGLFACLHSVITNTNYLNNVHFNFIILIDSSDIFTKLLIEFEIRIGLTLDKTIIYLDQNIIDKTIFESKCYNGGNHLLNIGNFSRLMIGEFMVYKKLIYLDSDSIVQSDIVKKLLYFNFDPNLIIYSKYANLINVNKKKQVVIKFKDILCCDYNWVDLLEEKINFDDYVYMGAPFITDCSKWNNVYKKIIQIIKTHNNWHGGIYKLFTMSIQNILFYKKIGDITDILDVLPDLGSIKREWDTIDLVCKDILDWSGIYKPWFKNGLYKHIWIPHDIMGMDENLIDINQDKNTIEEFGKTDIYLNQNTNKFIKSEYLTISPELYKEFNVWIDKIVGSNNKKSIKFKILYVSDAKYLLSKMSRIRFWIIEEMGNNPNIEVFLTGPGFLNFNEDITLQENIINLNINFNLVIWYNPLNYNFDPNIKLPFVSCLIYNEMYNEKNTSNEINKTFTDIVIVHHYNDYIRYSSKLYENKTSCKFFYIPHHSNSQIFKQTNVYKDIDILISGIITKELYPLKYRLVELINKHKNSILGKYNIVHYTHPGYKNSSSFTSIFQIEYNNIINRSKLCLCCTSKYNYRLGKYVEIPMSSGIILGDLPNDDKNEINELSKFIIEINMNMTDDEILYKIVNILENEKMMKEKINYGLEWAKKYKLTDYVNKFIDIIKKIQNEKIFIIADDTNDYYTTIKNNFISIFPQYVTTKIYECSVIWYLSSYNYEYIPFGISKLNWLNILKNKKVVFTCNMNIIEQINDECNLLEQIEFIKKYGNKFHSISVHEKNIFNKYLGKTKIINKKLWFNNQLYFPIENKQELKKKYKLSSEFYYVGYFINSNIKLDNEINKIFFQILLDMYEENKNICVILNGLISQDLIDKIEKSGIIYCNYDYYLDEEINELYNCLDLYILASSDNVFDDIIYKAGLSKTPLISTKFGIGPELMARSSLFDFNNWSSYKVAKPNIELLYTNIKKLNTNDNIEEFKNFLYN